MLLTSAISCAVLLAVVCSCVRYAVCMLFSRAGRIVSCVLSVINSAKFVLVKYQRMLIAHEEIANTLT